MKKLQMPHSYASVPEEELYSISGGGPLGDALDLFFNNLRLDDFFFSGGLISFSFTFVPLLLFNVVKTGFNFVVGAYDTISNLFHFSREEKENGRVSLGSAAAETAGAESDQRLLSWLLILSSSHSYA